MARKKLEEPHVNHERWLVSYADFITLLFAFFVVMYATSQVEQSKLDAAMKSLQRAFASGGGLFSVKGEPFQPFDDSNAGTTNPPTSQDIGKYRKTAVLKPENLEEMSRKLRGLLEKASGFPPATRDLQVVSTKEGFKIRLSERVLFQANSAKLSREHLTFLYELGKRLKSYDAPIQVEGHTDNASSREISNFQLSLDRATNVVRFLVTGVKFPEENVSVAGYGDTRPLYSNDSKEGRARNRRVEIAVLTDDPRLRTLPW